MKKITVLLFTILLTIPFLHAQVSLVKDINSAGDAMPTYSLNRIEYNGKLLFAANDGSDGIELWHSDGTPSGTNLLESLLTNSNSSSPNGFHIFNNKVYFSAARDTQTRYELYSTDGTSSGLISYPKIRYGAASASPRLLTTFGNMLVFSARPSILNQPTPNYGEEILGFDGNPWSGGGDQIMIKDINDLGGSSSPEFYTELNNLLYFAATDSGTFGRELWVTNGTSAGTNLLSDIYVGVNGSNPADLIVFNNKLYFTAFNLFDGRELWVTDGTTAGTQMVFDLNVGSGSGNPENLTIFNNALYFTATHQTLGTEVFKMTTTENITLLKNIAPGVSNSNPSNLFVSNGKLYFSADDGVNGRELWSSTGFSSTTNMLKNINPTSTNPDSNPNGFTEYFGELYFVANDGVNGVELWKTNGTNAGTVLVEDINTSGDSNPTDLIVANNILFFSANDGSTGNELWKYQDPSLSVEQFDDQEFALFPNPAKDSFTIKTNQMIKQVTLYDLQGKTVKSFDSSLESYTIKELTSGLYFVNIKSDTREFTKKLIKN